VHDEATTELMLAFYAALENGVAREKALREAQLAVREKWIHPFYWAAWVLDGDNGLIHVRPWNQIIS
jgi:CHAT domain-containing protein